MKNKGFTLIELLVVVLIIGILSAVALPQYQRTVEKSRTAEAWINLHALSTAVQEYCLANPNDNVSLDNLIIEPKSDHYTYAVRSYLGQSNMRCQDKTAFGLHAVGEYNGKTYYLMTSQSGGRRCAVDEGGDDSICKMLGFASPQAENRCFSDVDCFAE